MAPAGEWKYRPSGSPREMGTDAHTWVDKGRHGVEAVGAGALGQVEEKQQRGEWGEEGGGQRGVKISAQ